MGVFVMKKIISMLVIFSMISNLSILYLNNNSTVYASSFTQISNSYEETSKLPFADPTKDIPNYSSEGIFSTRSASERDINYYKKLGYKNIEYGSWSGVTNVISTKATRIAKLAVTQILGLIPSNAVKGALLLYDVSEALKTQDADIWPTVNARFITATAPAGYRVIIGEESIVKYYSNSARTKLIKTIHKTYWV